MKYSKLKKTFKNKYVIRVVAGVLTIAMLGTGYGAYSVSAKNVTEKKQTTESVTETKEETNEVLKAAINELFDSEKTQKDAEKETGKDETVYLIADNKGNMTKTIVSDWLKNTDGNDTLTDASDLTDIENVKGDETFTKDGSKLIWQADGNDIHYQGTTKKEAPVTEAITYYLDGKEIEPEELAGKSGEVTIRFDYTNTQKTKQTVDGEEYEVYVPFTVVTGMILGDNFKNVDVNHGKIISDGKNQVVVGMAMPGLKESLAVDESDFDEETEFPDYVEVTADVTDFSLDMTVTLVTSDLLNSMSTDGELDLSALEDTLDEMTDASAQLVDGSGELAEGMNTLQESLAEFTSGAANLKKGISDYTGGAKTLADGIGTLNSGTGTLAAGVESLNSGASVISKGIAKLDEELNTSTVLSDKKRAQIKKQVEASVEQSFADDKNNDKSYNNIKKTTEAALKSQMSENKELVGAVSSGVTDYTKQVLTGVLTTAVTTAAQAQVETAVTAAVREQVEAQVEAAVTAGVKAQVTPLVQQAVTEQVTAAVRAQADAQVRANAEALGLTTEEQITAAVESQMASAEIQQTITTQVSAQMTGAEVTQTIAEKTAYQMTLEAQKQLVESNIAAQMASDNVKQTIASNVESQMASDTIKNQIITQVSAAVDTAMADAAVTGGIAALSQGVVDGIADGIKGSIAATVADAAKEGAKTAAVTAAQSAAESGANEAKATIADAIEAKDEASGESLVTGAAALAAGTQSLADQIPTLTGGITQLLTGANTLTGNNDALNHGASALFDGTTQLVSGVDKLDAGANELADGMEEFDEKAIEKLAETYHGDVKSLLNRVDAIMQAGEDYMTFTDLADDMNGSVKFIIKTDKVSSEK